MGTPSLQTPRLELRPGTARALRAALLGREYLGRELGVEVPAAWPPDLYDQDAVEWTLRELGDRDDGGPFGFYYFILRGDQHGAATSGPLIGAGGFKGSPNTRGEVEIGYSVLSTYRRQGYASEAVRAWIDLAFADPRVETVVGQTLEGLTPSIGVLEKAGFSYAGAGDDAGAPEGERVIRYELVRVRPDAGVPLTVRRLDRSDASAWAVLRKHALELHPLAFGATVPDEPASLVERFPERLAPLDEAAVFGAFDGTTMTGIVGVRRNDGKKERHKATIWGMFVSPAARGRGAGALLLQRAISHARTWAGVEQMHLSVSEVAVEAQRLYVAHGFRPWGREPRALQWAGRYVDEIHMVLSLLGENA